MYSISLSSRETTQVLPRMNSGTEWAQILTLHNFWHFMQLTTCEWLVFYLQKCQLFDCHRKIWLWNQGLLLRNQYLRFLISPLVFKASVSTFRVKVIESSNLFTEDTSHTFFLSHTSFSNAAGRLAKLIFYHAPAFHIYMYMQRYI